RGSRPPRCGVADLSWMAGSSPAMTARGSARWEDGFRLSPDDVAVGRVHRPHLPPPPSFRRKPESIVTGMAVAGLSPSPLWGGWRQPGGGGHNRSARYSPTRPLRGHPPREGGGRTASHHSTRKRTYPRLPATLYSLPIRSRGGRFAQRTWGDRAAGGGRYRHPW